MKLGAGSKGAGKTPTKRFAAVLMAALISVLVLSLASGLRWMGV